MTEEGWQDVRSELETSLGADAFNNWIAPLVFEGERDGVVRFGAPSTFIGNWVDRNYGARIHDLMQARGVAVDRLVFGATTTPCARQMPSAPAPAPAQPIKRAAEVPTNLDQRFTFDRFVVGKPNELAYAAARRVAESETVSFNPLFLYGGVGLGKTHLMHAVAWEILRRKPEAKVLYLTAEKFMMSFVQALQSKDMMNFKEMFRSVDVLLVDDVQFISGKDSTQDEFFYTFNALIDQQKQIVISGDRAPGEYERIEERIRSRLQWGLVVDVHPTDYELRYGIISSKAQAMQQHYPEVEIAPGVFEFLAARISSNVRVLEGALTRLFAFGSLAARDKPVTLDMAQESLSDILRQSERKVTVEEIIRKVAAHYNIKVNDILSERRPQNIARPRQIGMYLARQLTSKSLPEIGRRFGGRDHATVLYAVKRVNELRRADAGIDEDVEILRRALEA